MPPDLLPDGEGGLLDVPPLVLHRVVRGLCARDAAMLRRTCRAARGSVLLPEVLEVRSHVGAWRSLLMQRAAGGPWQMAGARA